MQCLHLTPYPSRGKFASYIFSPFTFKFITVSIMCLTPVSQYVSPHLPKNKHYKMQNKIDLLCRYGSGCQLFYQLSSQPPKYNLQSTVTFFSISLGKVNWFTHLPDSCFSDRYSCYELILFASSFSASLLLPFHALHSLQIMRVCKAAFIEGLWQQREMYSSLQPNSILR